MTMKKSFIRILAVVLAVTIFSACLTAGAELKLNTGEINVNTGIRISVDGKEFVPVDSEGVPVEVFLYEGTTYLPVRGISNLFGLGIEWDNDTKSVYLGSRNGKELPVLGGAASVATSPFAIESKTIPVYTGVSIYFNDEYFQPTDSEGFSVEVFLYNGTTYLPVRAISTLMNAEIDWDQANKTVLLSVDDGSAAIIEAAKATAKGYTDTEALVLPYYRYYLKACTVIEAGLEELKALYLADPSSIEMEYMHTSYVMAYDGFEKEFGTYINKSVDLYELAKTVNSRIDTYAEGGYTADELDKLATNTAYLKDNAKYFSEYITLGAPEYMMEYFKDNAGAFGAGIVEELAAISVN